MMVNTVALENVEQRITAYLSALLRRDRPELGRLVPQFLAPFQAISDEALTFLRDPFRTPEEIDKAALFAREANAIPESFGEWHYSQSMLWDVYAYWIDHYEYPPQYLTPEEEKRLLHAIRFTNEYYDVYTHYGDIYVNARGRRMALEAIPERDRPPNYEELLRLAWCAEDLAAEDWERYGQRDEFEIQYMRLTDLSRRDMSLAKAYLRKQFGDPFSSRLYGEFYLTMLAPREFPDPAFPWIRYTIPPDEAREIGIGDTIAFDMIVPAVTRAWFSGNLLGARSWKWRHSTPQDPFGGFPLSTGGLEPEGHLIGFVSAMIFLRNIVVTGVNLDLVTVVKGRDELHLGPFSFPARHLDRETRTLSIDVVQLSAMLTSAVKRSPDPDWSLWEPHVAFTTENERV
jgi:hypothetical protein